MHVVVVDAPHPEGWQRDSALRGFAGVAGVLISRGHRVTVGRLPAAAPWPADAAASKGAMGGAALVTIPPVDLSVAPIVVATPGGLANGEAMRASWAVLQWLRTQPADLIVLPERGGLGFYAAMARATGLDFAGTRFVTIADGGTAEAILADDTFVESLDPLCADAMERRVTELVDLVVSGAVLRDIERIEHAAAAAGVGRNEAGPFTQLAFLGPLDRRHGFWLWLDTIERLAAAGQLDHRLVRLIGPMRPRGAGATRENLGVRAGNWAHRWRLDAELSRAEALATLTAARAVVVADDPGMAALAAAARRLGVRVIDAAADAIGAAMPTHIDALFDRIVAALGEADAPLDPMPRDAAHTGQVTRELADDLERLAAAAATALRRVPSLAGAALAGAATPPAGAASTVMAGPIVTVCLLTRDRAGPLQRALASLAAQTMTAFEVVVVDDASTDAAALSVLDGIEAGSFEAAPVRLIRNRVPRFPAAARNVAMAAARGRFVVFLDDDNVIVPDGLRMLVHGIELGGFDLLVSVLDAFSGEVPLGPTVTAERRLLFLGDAGAAGLFANLCGDSAMIADREALQRIGGFPDPGYFAPAEDWAMVTAACLAGSSVGVLVEPAFRYHQPHGVFEAGWRKRNQEGALRRIFDLHRRNGSHDLDLAAALGQRMVHRDLGL